MKVMVFLALLVWGCGCTDLDRLMELSERTGRLDDETANRFDRLADDLVDQDLAIKNLDRRLKKLEPRPVRSEKP